MCETCDDVLNPDFCACWRAEGVHLKKDCPGKPKDGA